MRKRMLSAAMAGMMAVSMTACGGSKPAETTAAATEAATSAEETKAEETTAEAADEAPLPLASIRISRRWVL